MNEWILVIDDDPNNLKAASHILLKSGMRQAASAPGRMPCAFFRRAENGSRT